MRHTRMQALLEPIGNSIADLFSSSPARAREHLAGLVEMVCTASIPPLLAELGKSSAIRGLSGNLSNLAQLLQEKSQLPEALYCHYHYSQSTERVMREWGINEKDWNLIHQLAREAGLSLALLYTSGRIVNLPWLDALEEDMSGVMVSLDSNALDDMLLSTLEGFLSPRSGRRKGYEVYGLCLGMTKCKQIKKTGRGMREEKHIHIHRAVPQLSAEGDFLSVEWREKSIEALLSASGALFPHYSIIADWHSHPYDAIEHLVARRGYLPSESDEMDNMRWFEHMQQQGEKPEVSFVLAIARTRNRPRSNRFRGEENTLQLHVGGCRIIISANRILQSGQYSSKNIQLSIPGLVS